MQVIYLHTDPWISSSPGVTFVTMTAIGLAKAGAEAHLVVPGVVGNNQGEIPDLLRTHFTEEPTPGLHIHRLAYERRTFIEQALTLVASVARADAMVIVRSLSLLGPLLRLRRKMGFRCYFEVHNCFFAPWQRDDASLWTHWKAMLRERLYLPQIDGLLCLQQAQADLFRRHLGERFPIHLVPQGFPATVPENGAPRLPTKPVLAYLGSLDAHKGLDCIARLASAYTDAQILIIGGRNDAEITSVRAFFATHGCSAERLRITGWVDRHQMAEELATAHWGVCPLHDTYFNRHLTSPVKIHDYFAVGLPVIASDLPTIRFLVADDREGLIVDWEQPHLIAKRMSSLNADDYEKMSTAARSHAATWTWADRGRGLIAAGGATAPSTNPRPE